MTVTVLLFAFFFSATPAALAAPNGPPVNTVPGAQTTDEDIALVFSGDNDNIISISDPDAGSNPVKVTLSVTNGTLTLAPPTTELSFTTGDGTDDATMTFTGKISDINGSLEGLTFTPTANYNGAATLTIVTDDQGNTGTGQPQPKTDTDTVNITVIPVNDAPAAAATPGNLGIDEDANARTVSLSGTDTETSASNLKFTITEVPVGGVLKKGTTVLTAGAIFTGSPADVTYEPDADYNGPDSFKFKVTDRGDPDNCGAPGTGCDAPEDSTVVTVPVTVNPVNDAPVNSVPTGDQTTNEDTALVFSGVNGISISDVDAGSNPVKATLQATNGALTPGSTTGATISGNGTANMTLTGTVSDVNNALDGLGFGPTTNYNGAASLTITTDDQGNTGSGGAKNDADAINITVNAVNDAPAADAQSVTTDEDTPKTITLAGSDADGNSLTFEIVSLPTNGKLYKGNNTNAADEITIADLPYALSGNQVAYASGTNFNGNDSFKFRVNDGTVDSADATVSITVNPVNDGPTITHIDDRAIEEDTDTGDLSFAVGDAETPAGDLEVTGVSSNTTLVPNDPAHITFGGSGANRTMKITPAANRSGTTTITLTVEDGDGDTATVTSTITVNPANDPPIANDDAVTTDGGVAKKIRVLVNDTDADGDALTVIKVSNPKHGAAKINANNTVTYKPNANFSGNDSFTYEISDGEGGADTAKVSVTVRDTTAPKVVGMSVRGDNAKYDFTVTFSEAMDRSTINKDTFVLVKQGTTKPVAATVRYDAASKKAVLEPSRNLSPGTTYVLTVKGGASGAKDLAGNALARDKVWRFTV